MNETESEETEETCNVCGSPVVDSYGNLRCSSSFCPTGYDRNNLSWDSDFDPFIYIGEAAGTDYRSVRVFLGDGQTLELEVEDHTAVEINLDNLEYEIEKQRKPLRELSMLEQ